MSTETETIEVKRAKLAMLRIVADEHRLRYFEHVDKVHELEVEIFNLARQRPEKAEGT